MLGLGSDLLPYVASAKKLNCLQLDHGSFKNDWDK